MRQFIRHSTDIPIFLSVVSTAVDIPSDHVNSFNAHSRCAMIDVSVGGIACRVSKTLTVGQRVEVYIPSVTPCYRDCGEVMWCKPCGQGFEVGVCFVDGIEAYKSRMVQQVCQIEYYKEIVFEREGRLIDSAQASAEWIQKSVSNDA